VGNAAAALEPSAFSGDSAPYDRRAFAAFEQHVGATGKRVALGALAPGVVHEINNPLFGILGLVELLLADAEPGSKVHERLELIHATGLEIKAIVRAFVDFAREPTEHRSALALDEVAKEAIDLMRGTSGAKHVEIVERFGSEGTIVEGNRNQLKQIFINLISNAANATAAGRVEVAVARAGDSVVATVVDHGPGIAPDVLPRIFDPFATTRLSEGGTGLGLYISDAIARAHGGALAAGSTAGAGAAFTLRLPARRVELRPQASGQ